MDTRSIEVTEAEVSKCWRSEPRPAIMIDVTMHGPDETTPKEVRHERVVLRVPPNVDPDDVDLEAVAEIINSGVLTAEIDAANNYDPDLAV